jgi:hypothetical protein
MRMVRSGTILLENKLTAKGGSRTISLKIPIDVPVCSLFIGEYQYENE